MTGKIEYIRADATAIASKAILAHVCNDVGAWGAGFSGAVSRRWAKPETEYRRLASQRLLRLGTVHLVDVGPRQFIANMIAQRGVGTGVKRIDLEALRHCLWFVGQSARVASSTVVMPRIGCGLAGGNWAEVEPLVRECLVGRGVAVLVCDWP